MRTKQVYQTGEIAHIWANQRQESARNPQGNFSFSRRSLYSYSTIIAELYKHNLNICFMTTRKYSNTTSGQLQDARRGANFKTIINVWNPVDVWAYSQSFWENIDHWIKSALRNIKDSSKERIRTNTRIQYKQDAVNDLQSIVDFIAVFGLTIDTLKNKHDSYGRGGKMERKFDAKAELDYIINFVNGRSTILEGETSFLADFDKATQKADKQKQKAQQKALEVAQQKAKEYLAKWLKGVDIHYSHLRILPEIYLRGIPKGDATQVETSWGARVSIKEAKLLYLAMKSGKSIKGRQIDGYSVVEHTSEHIVIGCHKLLKTEIDRFAKKMNWSK